LIVSRYPNSKCYKRFISNKSRITSPYYLVSYLLRYSRKKFQRLIFEKLGFKNNKDKTRLKKHQFAKIFNFISNLVYRFLRRGFSNQKSSQSFENHQNLFKEQAVGGRGVRGLLRLIQLESNIEYCFQAKAVF
jgi:hypothetical protein